MSLISFQIFAIISIFLIALLSGLLPISIMQKHQKALAFGDAWASGIFLGAALFHMLPESEKFFSHADYPYASLFCITGFLLLLIIERSVLQITDPDFKKNFHITGILLLIILSIHSLIEGAAIGINVNFAEVVTIFIAVIAHKGSASFALASNLRRGGISKNIVVIMIVLFSLMSPIGIIFSSLALKFSSQYSDVMTAIFNAFAAGSFLYIGLRHILEENFAEYKHQNPLKEFFAILAGVILMGVIAIWT